MRIHNLHISKNVLTQLSALEKNFTVLKCLASKASFRLIYFNHHCYLYKVTTHTANSRDEFINPTQGRRQISKDLQTELDSLSTFLSLVAEFLLMYCLDNVSL